MESFKGSSDWEMIQAYNEWVFESGEAPTFQNFLKWKEQTTAASEKYKGVPSDTQYYRF